MALDRSKLLPAAWHGRPPFWERPSLALPDPWEPRCGFANSGAIRKACQRNPSPRLCRCRSVPRLGERPALAKRGKAFLTSDARIDGYTLAYVEPRLSRPDAAPTLADEGRGNPAHLGRRGQLYCRITKRSATEPLGPHCSTPPGYGRPIRHQPPARTRPVLRSAAKFQNPHLNIVITKLAWFSRRQD